MSQATVALPARPVSRRPQLRRLVRTYSFAFALVFALALLIANLIAQPHFGWTEQLATFAPLACAAMASTPSIISGRGGFDLTISPLMTFTSVLFVTWLVPAGLGGAISVPIILAIGAAVGTINGVLIVGLRVPPMVVTLSTYFIFIGLDLALVNTPKTLDSSWVQYLAGSVGPIPGGVFTIAVPVLIWAGLGLLPYRNTLFAVGSNDATAFSSGVNVAAVRIGAYAIGGLFAAIGGFALTGLVSSVDSSQASAYTLVAIAGVALGGTSLLGGRGGIIGSLLGAAVIYLVESLLSALQISTTWLQVVYGLALLFAVVLSAKLGAKPAVAGAERRGRGLRRGATRPARRRGASTHDRPAVAASPAVAVAPVLDAPAASVAAPAAIAPTAAPPVVVNEAPPRAAPQPQTPWQRTVSLQRRFPLLQIVALIAVFVYGASTLDGLDSLLSIKSILVLASLAGLASCGQTLLILMGGFDMSVSGFIVAGAIVVTTLTSKYHIPFIVGLLIAIVISGLLGGIAGQICHRYRIQPLIVTLAMGSIAVGAVQVQTHGELAGSTPAWLSHLASPPATTFGIGIPPLVAIWIVVAVAFGLFLHRTVPGRRLLATGANQRAADLALINTRRVWTAAFAFSAIASVLVGVLLAGFAGSVDDTLGNPYLFQSVAAVVVGGTVFGGPGDYSRTVIGALFLSVLTTVLIGHGANAADQQILYGAIVLLAVTLYGRDRALRDRI